MSGKISSFFALALWNDTSVALGVAMFSLVWSGSVAAIDRYSASSLKRRAEEIALATQECKERLCEKDRQIDHLEARTVQQGDRITELERQNERLTVTCQTLTAENQRLQAEIRRFSSQSNAKP